VIVINDHRTSLPRSHTIPLHHLTPASPVKKGDHVVILSGDYKGHVAKVVQCQKKERKVKILMDGWHLTYDFALVCCLTQEQ
jgi:hypothetical protein